VGAPLCEQPPRRLVGLPAWLVLLLVFALPAAEAGLLVGVFIPGETAVLVGGVVAHGGSLSLWEVMVAAALGAGVVWWARTRRHGPTHPPAFPTV
jgi:membrane-associated protein